MSTIAELLSWAQSQLNDTQALVDSQALLSHVTGQNRSWLFTWPDKALEASQIAHFKSLVDKRRQGQPIAYLVGQRGFWTLDLEVSKDTLIPRPETEHLVESALAHAAQQQALQVLDLGTGSGAIALAVACERPNWQITAVDFSQAALDIAQKNAVKHSIKNVQFILSDWFSAIEQRFDLILSNPPYIEDNDPHLDQGDLRFEPRSALASGPDGLIDIKKICNQAPHFLKPNGWLIFEHGLKQASSCQKILKKHGFIQTFTEQDLAGLDRVTGAKYPLDA